MWLWYMWPSRTWHFCSHCLEHCWKGYKIQQDTRGPDYNAGLLLALDKHIVILKYLVCFLEILCLKIIRWYCLLISAVISIKQKRCICWYIFRKPTFTQIRFTIKWLPKKVIKIKQRYRLILPFEKRAVAALIDDYNEMPSFLKIQKPL